MDSKTAAATLTAAILYTTGCGSDQAPDANGGRLNCATVIAYDEALVDVTAATNRQTDDPLVQITFSELTRNGREMSFHLLDDMYLHSVDLSADGSSATCTLPCSLFTAEGHYSMVVSAPAFASKQVEFEAEYANVDYTGCQTTYSGSYELSIRLDPDY